MLEMLQIKTKIKVKNLDFLLKQAIEVGGNVGNTAVADQNKTKCKGSYPHQKQNWHVALIRNGKFTESSY